MQRPRFSTRGVLAAGGLAGTLVAAGLAACSGDGGTSNETTPGSTGAGTGGTEFTSGSTSGSSGIDPDAACATAVEQGKTLPVTMFIMFDKSGSMLDDQKWAQASAALIAFFQDDASAGLSVALRFFPDDAPAAGCNETACSVDACSQPLVDAGELTAATAANDPQQKALVEAVQSKTPSGQTPMFAALGGPEKSATPRAASSQAGDKTVVILVTDGEPNGCNEDVAAIAGLAGDASATAGVLTYAIGMDGANKTQLDQIAALGKTDAAIVIGKGKVNSELVAALKKIKKTQIACAFAMPQPADVGSSVDPGEVNVNYTSGIGALSTIGQVPGASACGSGGGWYYDDPEAPTLITLCPSTCDEVQADPDAKIDILLGCATVVK